MKNLLLLLIASASIISCKKQYTCTCTNSSGNVVSTTIYNVGPFRASQVCPVSTKTGNTTIKCNLK